MLGSGTSKVIWSNTQQRLADEVKDPCVVYGRELQLTWTLRVCRCMQGGSERLNTVLLFITHEPVFRRCTDLFILLFPPELGREYESLFLGDTKLPFRIPLHSMQAQERLPSKLRHPPPRPLQYNTSTPRYLDSVFSNPGKPAAAKPLHPLSSDQSASERRANTGRDPPEGYSWRNLHVSMVPGYGMGTLSICAKTTTMLKSVLVVSPSKT